MTVRHPPVTLNHMARLVLQLLAVTLATLLASCTTPMDRAPRLTSHPDVVTIPEGDFTMGDLAGNGQADERPTHTVTVTAFALGRHEVTTPAERHRAMTWAQRLKRVFGIEIETCLQCGGKVKVIASIEDPVVIAKILGHLAAREAPVRSRPPTRGPPQEKLGFP